MPLNPQSCLLSSANFIMLTVGFQARDRKTSEGYWVSQESGSRYFLFCSYPSSVPASQGRANAPSAAGCLNKRVLDQVPLQERFSGTQAPGWVSGLSQARMIPKPQTPEFSCPVTSLKKARCSSLHRPSMSSFSQCHFSHSFFRASPISLFVEARYQVVSIKYQLIALSFCYLRAFQKLVFTVILFNLVTFLLKKIFVCQGATAMSQWLTAWTALSEDQSLDPSTHMGPLPNT